MNAFAAAGLLAACQDESFGGMRLPYVVERAGLAFVLAACPTTAAYAFLTIANANLLLNHGTPSQVERFVRPMLDGRWTGTMCLSEAHAGSSLADITTRAERQPDGTYRLSGNKMWISGGDHDLAQNIVHLVLAKVPDERGALRPGVAGISLFVVPKYTVGTDGTVGARNDIAVAGLNHKMGYRGTSNCLLNFGEGRYEPGGRPGAVGELVGEEDRGLALMFQMMNEARITVGLGAAAIGYTGYLHSLDYARNRRQGAYPGSAIRCARPFASWTMPTCAGCSSRKKPLWKAPWHSCCFPRRSSTKLALRPRMKRGVRMSFSSCSPRCPRAGPPNGAWPPTTSQSRSTADTDTRRTTTSNSSTGTIA